MIRQHNNTISSVALTHQQEEIERAKTVPQVNVASNQRHIDYDDKILEEIKQLIEEIK